MAVSSFPTRFLDSVGDQALSRVPGGRLPLSGQWEITGRCNLRCRMCYTAPLNSPASIRRELSTAEILRLLDELQEAGCLELTFTGGEPLARPDFLTIYEAAFRRGFLLAVYTNGTLISETLADRWAELPPQKVEITLHGVSEEVFERVTQSPGSYRSCRRAMDLLLERRIPLTLKTVAMTLNEAEILDVKRLVDGLGSSVGFRLGEWIRDDLQASGDPLQFQLPEDRLRAIARQDDRIWKEKQPGSEPSARKAGCHGGCTRFHIDAHGRLHLCTGNRLAGYDLRQGSFRVGFYERFPDFPCPRRRPPRIPSPLAGEGEDEG